MRIDSYETFLDVWDQLGDLAELAEEGDLPPEAQALWCRLVESVRVYEEETMRPPPKGQSSFDNDAWFSVIRQAMTKHGQL